MASRLAGRAAAAAAMAAAPAAGGPETAGHKSEGGNSFTGLSGEKEEGRWTRRLGGKHLSCGGDTSRCVSLPQGPLKKMGWRLVQPKW